MAVSINWGSFWVCLYQKPYYLGSVLEPLIFGNSHIWACRVLHTFAGFGIWSRVKRIASKTAQLPAEPVARLLLGFGCSGLPMKNPGPPIPSIQNHTPYHPMYFYEGRRSLFDGMWGFVKGSWSAAALLSSDTFGCSSKSLQGVRAEAEARGAQQNSFRDYKGP